MCIQDNLYCDRAWVALCFLNVNSVKGQDRSHLGHKHPWESGVKKLLRMPSIDTEAQLLSHGAKLVLVSPAPFIDINTDNGNPRNSLILPSASQELCRSLGRALGKLLRKKVVT